MGIELERFNANSLVVGEVIGLIWVNRYQHGATMRITKVNKKSFKAIELKGSYGGPIEPGTNEFWPKGRTATVWNIHKTANFIRYPNYDDETMDWRHRRITQYPEHYAW